MLASQLAIFASLTLVVTATRLCKCQGSGRHSDHIFSGIQEICRDLSSDWCSTDCNFAGKNCDFCQFRPAGEGPNDDYNKLKGWCRQQYERDPGQSSGFYGEEVNCYTPNQAQHHGIFGCRHENNGDDAPQSSKYEQPDTIALFKLLPAESVIEFFPKTKKDHYPYYEETCEPLSEASAKKVSISFLAQNSHPGCEFDAIRRGKIIGIPGPPQDIFSKGAFQQTNYQIYCDLEKDKQPAYSEDFLKLCKIIGEAEQKVARAKVQNAKKKGGSN